MILKALPSKCYNHSEQINKAAFTAGLVCSQRYRGTKVSGAPGVLGQPFLSPFAALLLTGRQTTFVAGKPPNFTLTGTHL